VSMSWPPCVWPASVSGNSRGGSLIERNADGAPAESGTRRDGVCARSALHRLRDAVVAAARARAASRPTAGPRSCTSRPRDFVASFCSLIRIGKPGGAPLATRSRRGSRSGRGCPRSDTGRDARPAA
jgi:hypothetical protein